MEETQISKINDSGFQSFSSDEEVLVKAESKSQAKKLDEIGFLIYEQVINRYIDNIDKFKKIKMVNL